LVLPSLADTLIIIIFIIPGFLAFYIFRWIGAYGKDYSEFEITTWSLIFSVVIIFGFTIFTGLTDIDSIRDEFFYHENFAIFFRIFRKGHVLSDPWEIAIKEHKSGSWLLVYTKNGQEYRGWYRVAGITRHSLAIDNVTQFIRSQSGDITKELKLEGLLLFNDDDIARVVFIPKKKLK
jgi:hypothetical protein